MTRPRLVFFSDLDGTLLDHDTYDWSAAKPALEKLELEGLPVVLNSSKTAPEIQALRRALGNTDPYIVENGAAVIIPPAYFDSAAPRDSEKSSDKDEIIKFGAPRSELLKVLAELRQDGYSFESFEDMTAEEVAQHTGLPPESARLAKQRLATEPLLWRDQEIDIPFFRKALEQRGLRLVRGGRFQHVMGAFDKAESMQMLMKRYRALYSGEKLISVALGDGPNDRRMLEQADIAIVIKSAGPEPLRLPDQHRVMYSGKKGPEGWNECVLTILAGEGY
ncbi:MAG: HAD-IIB family hydrolase [Oleiphilaceae bacterium]|nr:HAD-IIB family hydrolase [Oleiphilaceae bacterium]